MMLENQMPCSVLKKYYSVILCLPIGVIVFFLSFGLHKVFKHLILGKSYTYHEYISVAQICTFKCLFEVDSLFACF